MCAQTPEYKETLNLPKTDFPMRASLPKREPAWLERWEKLGIYDRLRSKTGRRSFFARWPPICQWQSSHWPRSEQDTQGYGGAQPTDDGT